LFPRLIKTFAVAVTGQNNQSFLGAGGVGIKGLSNGRRHPAVILESNEENGAITDTDHGVNEVKVGRAKISPPGNPIDHFIGDGKTGEMKK
jgi:hypothetical protein